MGVNLAEEVNNNIIDKKMVDPLSFYTQSNCQITLTDDGYRIYRPPNITYSSSDSSTRTMWGGFIMRFRDTPFIKGHRYIINFEVKGKTSQIPSDTYWTNNAGWGGHGLDPTPSDVVIKNLPAEYNSDEWFLFSYAWTINDEIYKTCTSSYSSFVEGTAYNSYRDFKFGFTYQNTGTLGTDLYIKNVRMYDITTTSNIWLGKNGIMNADSFWETLSKQNVAIHKNGEMTANQFYEY